MPVIALRAIPSMATRISPRKFATLGGKRLFLHAYMLTVPLPDGGELKLQAPVDEMWAKTVERLSVAPLTTSC